MPLSVRGVVIKKKMHLDVAINVILAKSVGVVFLISFIFIHGMQLCGLEFQQPSCHQWDESHTLRMAEQKDGKSMDPDDITETTLPLDYLPSFLFLYNKNKPNFQLALLLCMAVCNPRRI